MNAPLPLPLMIQALNAPSLQDADPQETTEWREAFDALVATQGVERARFMLEEMARWARNRQVPWKPDGSTPYVNSIAVDQQPAFPGDLAIEERLASLMRWNALAMVVRANRHNPPDGGDLGGHISSFASLATMLVFSASAAQVLSASRLRKPMPPPKTLVPTTSTTSQSPPPTLKATPQAKL